MQIKGRRWEAQGEICNKEMINTYLPSCNNFRSLTLYEILEGL